MLPFSFGEEMDFYAVLDITPDATPEQVREGYLRAKSAYGKGSIALYTLMDAEETEETLTKIEEAYQILSTPEKRKDYDQKHGSLSGAPTQPFEMKTFPTKKPSVEEPRMAKVISIERAVPLAVASATQIDNDGLIRESAPAPESASAVAPPPPPYADPTFEDEIARETEWTGAFIKRTREARKLSIEEVCNITRIPKHNIVAIEEENFAKLPVAVFTRGFVTQVSKLLKLPHDKVALAYIARFKKTRPDT